MDVPKPESFRRFMFYCGPVLLTTAMGLGTSEVILYPHLTACYGVGWLFWVILALFFQTVWGMELARWVVVSGEHGVQANARVISRTASVVFILLALFVGLSIPVWATSAASALWEIIKWPGDIRTGAVVWGIVTFLVVFACVFFSRIARQWAELLATISLLASWIILIIAACCSISKEILGRLVLEAASARIPENLNLWTLGSTIAWVGTGPGLLWYTYWMRDAGWGMAKYIGPIPGWFGKTTEYKTRGILPTSDTPENVNNIKIWIRRSHWTIWLGYFAGSFVTILIFVALSYAILNPQTAPNNFEVIKYQAKFFIPVCGTIGATIFLIMAWLLFFNTQIGISESLVRQNADATTMVLGTPIKKSYFTWWVIYLVVSFILIFLLNFYKDLTIFKYITYAAMVSSVALLVSMFATFFGSFKLYRHLPAGIKKAVQPSPVWITILGIGVVYHLYWIIRAVSYQIHH